MTVDLFPLKRQGETVVAQFAFTVNSEKTDEDDDGSDLYNYLGGELDPFLVDSQNLRKHKVLEYTVDRAQTAYQGRSSNPARPTTPSLSSRPRRQMSTRSRSPSSTV